MQISITKRAGVVATALLSAAVIAGCGSSSAPSTSAGHSMSGMHGNSTHGGGPGMMPLVAAANGTTASAAGLTLKTDSTVLPAKRSTTLALTVSDARGMPITKFERDQTKLMHLIVVRDDFTGYQHIHPTLHPGGRFTVPLTLPTRGRYHAIADFTTGRKRYALVAVLTVPGNATRIALPPPSTMATVDGYDVSFAHGKLNASSEATLTFTVSRGAKPVTALQPYLGAYGHLVALRKPDLAYSHVHPTAHDPKAATITFAADFPTAATYRLFLQFRAQGAVHTAAFTIAAK